LDSNSTFGSPLRRPNQAAEKRKTNNLFASYSSRVPVFSREKGFGGKSDWFSCKRGRSELFLKIASVDRPKNVPAGRKKANKASIPKYRHGKAGKKTNRAFIKETSSPKSLFSRKDRGAGRVVLWACR